MAHSFYVSMHSVNDVEAFVSLASVQPFDVTVTVEDHRINGKSLMGVFTLDLNQPVRVWADCSEGEFSAFQAQAQQFRGSPN